MATIIGRMAARITAATRATLCATSKTSTLFTNQLLANRIQQDHPLLVQDELNKKKVIWNRLLDELGLLHRLGLTGVRDLNLQGVK